MEESSLLFSLLENLASSATRRSINHSKMTAFLLIRLDQRRQSISAGDQTSVGIPCLVCPGIVGAEQTAVCVAEFLPAIGARADPCQEFAVLVSNILTHPRSPKKFLMLSYRLAF